MLLSVDCGGIIDSTELSWAMPTKEKKGGAVITTLSMDTHLSTLLSMDSCLASHDELDIELNRAFNVSLPPDINLPLSAEHSPPPPSWNDVGDVLAVRDGRQNYETDVVGRGSQHFEADFGHGAQHCEAETHINVTKVGKKCAKRLDSVWGAWFFFSFYFKPALSEKSKGKVACESNGVSGYEKTDLKLDVFLVQHDMENMYMWAFKDRPENALGKMQLRSYMNGHSRQGERPFPFSSDKGFVRSHRMQRKHYRGLSNPQCVHGIEVVRTPNFSAIDEEEQKKWMELTGRDLNFSIPLEASDFGSWRTLPITELEIERLPPLKNNIYRQAKKMFDGSGLNLSTQQHTNHLNGESMDLLSGSNKRQRNYFAHEHYYDFGLPTNLHYDNALDTHSNESHWLNDFTGVMRSADGPVTAAKTIYEDDQGFLIIVSMPCADLQRVKVTWRNTLSHGIVKISCVSTGCMPTIKRKNRTFKLTDPTPEHCPPGEFIREIALPTRIPEDAKLEANGDPTGTMLEINVPKHRVGPEEHEVQVCLRPPAWSERAYVDLADALL